MTEHRPTDPASDLSNETTPPSIELPPLEPYETSEQNREALMRAVTALLSGIQEDPSREGLVKTPLRVAKSMMYLTKGYREDPADVINGALFEEDCEEMVLVKDVDFFSLCEHHLLPFFGKAHVAYIPHKKILGLSKVARIVEIFARRLQVQERLTQQIAKTLEEHLQPRGVAVVLEGQHLCMQMRGVERQNSVAVTSSILGLFRTSADTRAEFMTLIGHSNRRG